MPDIFLRQGAANPNDILLRDPTQPDAGGAITASISESQASQSESIVATELYSAVISESQAAQSESIVAAEKYSATIVEAQASQTESIVAAEKYSASIAELQASQSEAITATEKYSATVVEAQAAQTEAIAGTVVAAGAISADIAEAQSVQTESLTATNIPGAFIVPPATSIGSIGGNMPHWFLREYLEIKPKKKAKKKTAPVRVFRPIVLDDVLPHARMVEQRALISTASPNLDEILQGIKRQHQLRDATEARRALEADSRAMKEREEKDIEALLLL